MNEVKIVYRIVTPMFIGGADKKVAELRIPSIKGVLRFWYRAIESGFRDNEMRIFGGTDEGVGQAKFLIRLENRMTQTTNTAFQGNIATLAYGVEGRSYIKNKETFTLRLIFKPNISSEDALHVKCALWAMTMFGGLGARSRKGFGSLVATSVTGMDTFPSLMPEVKDLNKSINQFITDFINIDTSSLPEHSCWSNQSRCIITGQGCNNSDDAHEWLANKIHDLRSTQGSNFFLWPKDDCSKMRAFSEFGTPPLSLPLRTAFGLPHNYYFTDLEYTNVEINYMEGGKKGRRGSLLFFHIYERGGKACVIATFFPARLIPAGEQVRLEAYKKQGNRKISGYPDNNINLPNNFQAITDILDEFKTSDYQGMEIEQ